MTTRPSERGERLYRWLLNLYPKRAREEVEAELMQLYYYRRDEHERAHGRLGPRFWWFMTRDLAVSAWRERRDPLDMKGRPPVGSDGGGDGMMGWLDDLLYAGRRLRRSPGFALTALTILVLGIGVNSTAFSVVNSLLLQPPPFEDPERVVSVLQDSDGGDPQSTSYPAYLDMTRTEGVFASVSAFYNDQAFVEQDDQLASILVEYATASYMDVIGLSPSRGVWFEDQHDDPNGPPTAVLTHGMWMDRLAADPDVIGSTLRINGGTVTVIGVGPPEFNGGFGPVAVDMWLSISAIRPTGGRAASLQRRQDHPFYVRARLAPGVSLEQASASMNVLASDLARDYPEINANRGIHVLSVMTTRVTPSADAQIIPGAILAMVLVVLVLVIGTLNLANLLLVRSTARAREIAVRLALGAGRSRVIRVVMGEALLLAMLGGAGGLGIAALTARMLRNSRLDVMLPVLIDLRLDGWVITFTAVLSILTGVVFGLVPALRATRRDVNATLRDEATAALGSRRIGLTGVLVAGQVAVSLLLLTVAGVFVESLIRAQNTDPGFDWEGTAYLTVNAQPLDFDDESTLLLFEQLEERFEGLPGVQQATTALMLPGAQFGTTTLLLGSGLGGVDRPTEIPWNYVSLDYFDVMDVPLLHGRLLTEDDIEGDDVAVVSEAFARTYWGRSDVAGETYRSEGSPDEPREIVGVVGNTTVRSLGEAPSPSIYWPIDFAYPRMHFVFEVSGSQSETLTAARSIVRETDPRVMILASGSMADFLGDTLERERLAGGLLGALGFMALGLSMLGVYGVVSFAVSRRRQEVGIRIALGAGGESVIGLFIRDVSVVVFVGALLGVAASLPVGRLVGQLFTGGGASPLTTAGVAGLLLVTSLIATVIPAAKATRTDPTDALRQE